MIDIKNINLINNFYNNEWKLGLYQVCILIFIGFLCSVSPEVLTIFWIGIIIYSLIATFIGQTYRIWYFIGLSPGMELFVRIARNTTVPTEIGKYYLFLVIILFSFSYFDKRTKVWRAKFSVGGFILLLLIPSIIVGASVKSIDIDGWFINISGIVQLSILLMFLARERWTMVEYHKILKFALLPIIPILTFLILKTPKFEEADFAITANYATSGGFGPNQVATILGGYLAIATVFFIINKKIYEYSLINIIVILLLAYRGLLTLSRGGMLIGILAMIAAFLVNSFKSKKNLLRQISILTVITIFSIALFSFVNKFTNDTLLMRYMGETEGTIDKTKEKTLNTITSNRADIALTDLKIFVDNLLFGVGPGESRHYRKYYGGTDIAPHTEYSRMLSEHGLGGLIAIIILTIFPMYWIYRIPINDIKALSIALFIVSIGSSFHAAMRTNITVVFYLLACMPLVYKKADNNE